MTNQEYFDCYIEQKEDYTNLPILEQLSYLRTAAPFNEADIIKHFGADFVNNCRKAHLVATNSRNPGTLFINWANIKDFEEFIREKQNCEEQNLF